MTFRILTPRSRQRRWPLSDAERVRRSISAWLVHIPATAMIDTTAPAIRTPTRPLRAFRRSMRSAPATPTSVVSLSRTARHGAGAAHSSTLTSFPRHCDSPASRPGTTSAADWRRMVPHGAGPPSKPRHLSLAGTPSARSAWDNPRRVPSRPQPGSFAGTRLDESGDTPLVLVEAPSNGDTWLRCNPAHRRKGRERRRHGSSRRASVVERHDRRRKPRGKRRYLRRGWPGHRTLDTRPDDGHAADPCQHPWPACAGHPGDRRGIHRGQDRYAVPIRLRNSRRRGLVLELQPRG